MQRTGVGSRLLNRLEESLGKNGVNTVYLGTHKGTPAEAFYRKHGYEASAEDIEMSHDLDDLELERKWLELLRSELGIDPPPDQQWRKSKAQGQEGVS